MVKDGHPLILARTERDAMRSLSILMSCAYYPPHLGGVELFAQGMAH